MKILVVGANGQLGKKLQDWAKHHPTSYDFLFTDVDTLDICDKSAVEKTIQKYQIEIIINCAAYTAVDNAEKEQDISEKLNGNAVGILANLSAQYDVFFVHISTDYVFDGQHYKPYTEVDNLAPISVYGRTKLLGEKLFIKSKCKGVIIRTSWLYSEYGNNFLKTMLRLGKEKKQINVVCDQVGTPTYAGDLANVIMTILAQKNVVQQQEIYHYSNEGAISWYDFSKTIMEISSSNCSVKPILAKNYPTLAQRPYYSVLDKSKIKSDFNIEIPYWKESLYNCMQIIENQ